MKCDKCGNPIYNRLVRINNTTLCEDCARELGVGMDPAVLANSAMRILDNEMSGIFPSMMNSLEFSPTRTQIKCPKCGTTLKDFETTGLLGCIECYNTFNESVMRNLMKSQATTQYRGRAPQIPSEDILNVEDVQSDTTIREKDNTAAGQSESVQVHGINEVDDDEKLKKYESSDFSSLSKDELMEAIKLSVAKENYMLAAKFRDELKGRGDN